MTQSVLETLLKEGVWSTPEYSVTFILILLGLYSVLNFLAKFFLGIWNAFLRPGVNLRKYGNWAIVTGATDGIGRGYAKQLAKRRINLILVSRSEEKLKETSEELSKKHGVSIETVSIDLTASDLETALKPLEKLVADLDVGILINNAGMSYPFAQYLHEVDDELITKLLKINVEAVTRLSKLVIPGMLKRRKGAIVNIGSGAATVLPSDPLYAVYAGTKGFVDQFSKTLAVEYKYRGIDVQCQAPLYVATKLAKIRNASLTCPSANTYAKYGVGWIGWDSVCTPYPIHSLMWWIITCLPVNLMNSIRFSQSFSIRKRALAKLLKKKAQ